MAGGYLVVLGQGPAALALRDRARQVGGLRALLQTKHLVVLTEKDLPCLSLGEAGCVLGRLFDNTVDAAPLSSLTSGHIGDVVRSAGQWLIDNTWGGYLAVIAQPGGGVRLLRDPSGALPVYWVRHEGLTLVCSSLDLALEAGLPAPTLDWPSVGQILAYPHLRGVRTGLRGVDELLPGVRASIGLDHDAATTLAWSPWTFAARDRAFEDPDAAAAAVREAVNRSVRAWAQVSAPRVLELSGGLDSSIIATALAEASGTTFVNFHTVAAEADERRYARKAAAAGGGVLVEREVDATGVDVRRARPGRHPRPASQALLQPIEAAFSRLGEELGTAAFFTGLGGDNVFCAISTAAPATDALLSFGLGRRFLNALSDLARLHQATLWDVTRLAVRKAFVSNSNLGLAPVNQMLARDVTPGAPNHPWLPAPSGILPGKREHVASLLVAQGFLDRYEHAALAAVRYPLLAQPVLEACLRVPTWMSIAGGRNRALARDAFADVLPEEIYRRQTKSGLNAFMGAAFEANRPALADQLTRGWLVTAGLADGQAIRQVVENPAPNGLDIARVLYLADVEAWARTWGQT
jgi:asparagine synthase (glutamine-hydrolysing)